jgi:hypothetical protein
MEYKKIDMKDFYEEVIMDIDHSTLKLNELREYVTNALKFCKEYENPTFTISEIFPKVSGEATTQKPYYRASSSFTNAGKKERISCYLGPIEDFEDGKKDFVLKKIAIKKIREQMIEKSKLPSKEYILNAQRDKYLENSYSIYRVIRFNRDRNHKIQIQRKNPDLFNDQN